MNSKPKTTYNFCQRKEANMSMLCTKSQSARKTFFILGILITASFVGTDITYAGEQRPICPPEFSLEIGGDYDGACSCIIDGRNRGTFGPSYAWQYHDNPSLSMGCPGGQGGSVKGTVHTAVPPIQSFPPTYQRGVGGTTTPRNPTYGRSSSGSRHGDVK